MRQNDKLGVLTAVLALAAGPWACASDPFTSTDSPATGDAGGVGGSGATDAATDASAGAAGTAGSGGVAGSAGDGGSTTTGGSGGSAGTSGFGGGAGLGGAAGSGGSATGGSNSGGSGGSSGASGSGGTGGSATEDCLNGVDDDNNGKTDCADPACQIGYVCVPPAPADWMGIGWIEPQLATCPVGLPSAVDLFQKSSLSAPPATCACECGSPNGVQCGTHAGCWSSANECNNGTPNKGTGTQCAPNVPTIINGSAWCKAGPPGASGGSCVADSMAVAEPWVWPAGARACLRTGGGTCVGAAGVCVPKLAGSTGKACVAKLGDAECPPLFNDKTLYYDGTASDQRSCDASGCACGAPSGSTCGCSGAGCQVQLYGTVACGGTPASFPTDDACMQVQMAAVLTSKLANASVDEPGSCSPSGSATPTGAVTPTQPITVCCVP